MALVETAHSALDKPEEDETAKEAKVLTLRYGLEALKKEYADFDVAIMRAFRDA